MLFENDTKFGSVQKMEMSKGRWLFFRAVLTFVYFCAVVVVVARKVTNRKDILFLFSVDVDFQLQLGRS